LENSVGFEILIVVNVTSPVFGVVTGWGPMEIVLGELTHPCLELKSKVGKKQAADSADTLL
jgi:hypothetical protein